VLEVLNLVVGIVGVIVTAIGTVVAIQQLRLQRRLVAPATVTDDQRRIHRHATGNPQGIRRSWPGG